MFFKNTVVFTTRPTSLPLASRTALRFARACVVCSTIPPATICMVEGTSGMQPETKTRSPALMACEYGPIAAGAFSVVTGLREEWVVTADIVRITCATGVGRITVGTINNLRLDDLGTILLKQTRAADFGSSWNIDCSVVTRRWSELNRILRSPPHISSI